jgi:4-aminobutyrate aminotransferase and related aminotransferases
MPIAAVTGRADIMDASHVGGLGGTFGGNPVAAAAVVAVFNQVEKRGLLAEAERIESVMRPGLDAIAARHDIVADVRGKGAMLAIELLDPTTKKPAADAVKAVQKHALHQGVMFLTAGSFGNVLRFLPSLVMTDDQIREGLEVLDEALASV